MRPSVTLSLVLVLLTQFTGAQELTSETNERLRQGLKQYPAADTNKDGILTLSEAQAFLKQVRGKKTEPQKQAKGPAPTQADVAYGPHERNKLDFWRSPAATAEKPAPLVVFIHGGGFVGGDKTSFRGPKVQALLDKGVSVASINYRFRQHAPIQDILRDAARAVQYLRFKGGEWGIDKKRIAAQGGSAGAGTSLWLATRDDLADPKAEDPVLRESSRVCACVLNATQATYNLTRWESFLGPADPSWSDVSEGLLFYGFKSEADLKSAMGQAVLHECDMLAWISKDDAPILCVTKQPDGPIQNRGHWLHHPKHALEIQKHASAANLVCQVVGSDQTASEVDFLLQHLKADQAL